MMLEFLSVEGVVFFFFLSALLVKVIAPRSNYPVLFLPLEKVSLTVNKRIFLELPTGAYTGLSQWCFFFLKKRKN